jgi:hypothetical protein
MKAREYVYDLFRNTRLGLSEYTFKYWRESEFRDFTNFIHTFIFQFQSRGEYLIELMSYDIKREIDGRLIQRLKQIYDNRSS